MLMLVSNLDYPISCCPNVLGWSQLVWVMEQLRYKLLAHWAHYCLSHMFIGSKVLLRSLCIFFHLLHVYLSPSASLIQLSLAQRPEEEDRSKPTWVHDIFQGVLVNETKCLSCETVRSKEEDFLDLSVDISQNTSLTHSLKWELSYHKS